MLRIHIENTGLRPLIKPPHLQCFTLLRHLNNHVYIVLEAIFSPEVPLFSGLENINE
ncbi:hypothetical protein SAMN04488128_102707 [Chitinophaga eiseniae]|uniref:Uncharacterized protein n=1 Tax=Chitinophaga eiseniae TaxID=634771 RepID=A0A1T4QZZ0_9BACT|nr:hypothetical protein SAMN04488128_102707 [Chitinophaga eiseniae]